ncbi:MAG: hypothetical protein EPN31_15580 [Castellaniella sp.]|uniref:DUF6531 domain-containing protein n=1 Tax=Castellaniella sp. TaxID=1955812 RepID=UPI001220363B|nr:DUF6531 domain-containing protein [Castellaniella sp.]TAN25328.1 MAG: hypothetical protein EPN31_15580 [Castellaniella sp.]
MDKLFIRICTLILCGLVFSMIMPNQAMAGTNPYAKCVQNGGDSQDCIRPIANFFVTTSAPFSQPTAIFLNEDDSIAYRIKADNYCSGPCYWTSDPQLTYISPVGYSPDTNYKYRVVSIHTYVDGSVTGILYSSQYAFCTSGYEYFLDATSSTEAVAMCRPAYGTKHHGSTSDEANPSSDLIDKEGCAKSCDPVDLATGELTDYKVDYQNKSPYPIVWSRYYNSFSKRWSFNYERSVHIEAVDDTHATLSLNREDSQTLPFVGTRAAAGVDWTWTPAAPSSSASWMNNPIVATISSSQDLTSVSIRNKHNEIETYEGNSGHLTKMEDLNGNHLLFTYNADNRLSKIEDSAGRHIDLSYDSSAISTTFPIGEVDSNGDPIIRTVSHYPSLFDMSIDNHPIIVSDGTTNVGYVYGITGGTNYPQVQLLEVINPDNTSVQYQYGPEENNSGSDYQ